MNKPLLAFMAITTIHFYLIDKAGTWVSAYYHQLVHDLNSALLLHTGFSIEYLYYGLGAIGSSVLFLRVIRKIKEKKEERIQAGLIRIGMASPGKKTKWQKRKGEIIIENKNCFTDEELENKVLTVSEIYKQKLSTVRIKGKYAIFYLKDLPKLVTKIKRAAKSLLYIGEGLDGSIFSMDFSILILGQTGSGKTQAQRSLIKSHILNNPDARIKIYDFKDEDFEDFKDRKNILFFRMVTKDDLKKAIIDLKSELDNRLASTTTLFVFDEIAQYLSTKNNISAKEEIKELISIVDGMLRTFRSSGKKIICATQRSQMDEIGVPFSNFQAKLVGRIDKSMENRVRPGLARYSFGKGIWSFEDSTRPPEILKTAYLKGE